MDPVHGGLGYRSSTYAASLDHLGEVIPLEAAGTHLIRRPVRAVPCQEPVERDAKLYDTCGAYPLLACADWNALASDLAGLADEIVSVVAVTDPLAGLSQADLEPVFPDVLIPFKRHYVVDLTSNFEATRSMHHQRTVRRALRRVVVERAPCPLDHADEWTALYAGLVSRLAFADAPANFSAMGLLRQLELEDMTYFRALLDGACVAACLFIRQGPHAYFHLAAGNDAGRKAEASYALVSAAIAHAAENGAKLVDIGGTASLADDESSGLSRFKRGWCTESAIAYLGGRVTNREAYDRLTAGSPATGFFPAYRAPVASTESCP